MALVGKIDRDVVILARQSRKCLLVLGIGKIAAPDQPPHESTVNSVAQIRQINA